MSAPLNSYVDEIMLMNIICGKLGVKDFDNEFQLYLNHLFIRGNNMIDTLEIRAEQPQPAISYNFLKQIFSTSPNKFSDLKDLLSSLLTAAIQQDYYIPKEMAAYFRSLGSMMKLML